MAHRIAFLDVFADRPLAGNGLAVVADADGVSDEVMLAFARETRLSETSFLQSPSERDADYLNRIWTPSEELPFAGHPSLGAAVAAARWEGEREARLVQQTGAGLQQVEAAQEGERWRASMLQAEPERGEELEAGAAMSGVGLEPGDAHPELPPQIVSTGLRHLIAPVAGPEALARALPDYPTIDELLRPHGAVVLYLCWCEPERGRAKARGFARIVEVGEDPATGSAAGPLCVYLADRAGCERLRIEQGEEIGRPSVLQAEIEAGSARVGGTVIPVVEGEVELPPARGDTGADA